MGTLKIHSGSQNDFGLGGVIVAASGASEYWKHACRMSGGTVCDGTDDHVQIAAAITKAGTGGLVILSPGTFVIEPVTIGDCTVQGQGRHTTVRPEATAADGFILGKGSRLWDIYMAMYENFTGNAVKVVAGTSHMHYLDILRNIYLYCDYGTGTGVYFDCTSNSILGCSFSGIHVDGFNDGIDIETANTTWFNDNRFYETTLFDCVRMMHMDNSADGGLLGNCFIGLSMEPASGRTTTGIDLDISDRNFFFPMVVHDWDGCDTGNEYIFDFDANSHYNTAYLECRINYEGKVNDASGRNRVYNITTHQGGFGGRYYVQNHTADHTLTAEESGTVITNYGDAGTQTQTLPASCLVGTTYKFIVGAAQELRVKVGAASDVFIHNGTTSTDDGGGDGYLMGNDEGEWAIFTNIASGVWLVECTSGGVWAWTQP